MNYYSKAQYITNILRLLTFVHFFSLKLRVFRGEFLKRILIILLQDKRGSL